MAYLLEITPTTLSRYEKEQRETPYIIIENYAKYVDYGLILIEND